MSRLSRYKVAGVKARNLLTAKLLAQAVSDAFRDLGLDPRNCGIESGEEAQLTATSYYGNTGAVNVRWLQRPVLQGLIPLYGMYAGLHIDSSTGEVEMFCDDYGRQVRAQQILWAIQKRILQQEIAKTLKCSAEEAWQLITNFGITTFNAKLVARLRLASLLASEFGMSFADAAKATQEMDITEKKIASLRERLELSDMAVSDLPASDLKKLAGILGFTVESDVHEIQLVPELAKYGVTKAVVRGDFRLTAPNGSRIVVASQTVEVKDVTSSGIHPKMTKATRWVVTGSATSVGLIKGQIERLQELAVGLQATRAIVAQAFEAGADVKVVQNPATKEIIFAVVEKAASGAEGMQAVAKKFNVPVEVVEAVRQNAKQLVQVMGG